MILFELLLCMLLQTYFIVLKIYFDMSSVELLLESTVLRHKNIQQSVGHIQELAYRNVKL